ncbi:MAG: hypothetical protein MJ198_05360 [Bacteroidales bacterium]|nr:hypothetical protein [Bacteroidales bacterium]
MNFKNFKIQKTALFIAGILLTIATINLYLANVVSVTSNMPKAVRPGATIPVTVTIDKGQIDGFGRFTCTLPKDFVATSTNQNFSFSDNTITVLWVKLPSSSSFSFDFNIIVPEKTKPFTFAAKFGYVQDNEKRFAELKPITVRVTNGAEEIPTTQQNTVISESTGKTEQLFEVGNLDDEENNYEITKTTETTTQVVSSKNPDLINDIFASNSAKPTMTSIEAEPTQITQTTTQTTTQVTTTTTTIKPIENPEPKRLETKSTAPEEKTAKATKTNTNATLTNKTSEVKAAKPKATNNVSFKVQVAATHKQIKNQQTFFAKRNINDNVSSEKIGEWYKYSINNNYDTYAKARSQRNTIWEQTPIKGAFVVAYNGKKRITVQEALMLSNQKWVK